MRSYIVLCAMALASCTGSGKKKITDSATMDSVKKDSANLAALNTHTQNMEYCFVHTDGTAAQDTTAVHLVINANKVSG